MASRPRSGSDWQVTEALSGSVLYLIIKGYSPCFLTFYLDESLRLRDFWERLAFWLVEQHHWRHLET